VKCIRFGSITFMVALLLGSNLSHPKVSQIRLPLSAATASAQQANTTQKIEQFLEQFGGTYTKRTEGIWIVPFQGKSLESLEIFVAVSQETDTLLMGATLVNKKNLRVSESLLYQLLKFNHSADYVKVGFDDDEDLFLRAELNAKTIDSKSFKEILEQVGAATDELHAQIKPALIAN
jgi:Putative bacterial sensory transduction regulator